MRGIRPFALPSPLRFWGVVGALRHISPKVASTFTYRSSPREDHARPATIWCSEMAQTGICGRKTSSITRKYVPERGEGGTGATPLRARSVSRLPFSVLRHPFRMSRAPGWPCCEVRSAVYSNERLPSSYAAKDAVVGWQARPLVHPLQFLFEKKRGCYSLWMGSCGGTIRGGGLPHLRRRWARRRQIQLGFRGGSGGFGVLEAWTGPVARGASASCTCVRGRYVLRGERHQAGRWRSHSYTRG